VAMIGQLERLESAAEVRTLMGRLEP